MSTTPKTETQSVEIQEYDRLERLLDRVQDETERKRTQSMLVDRAAAWQFRGTSIVADNPQAMAEARVKAAAGRELGLGDFVSQEGFDIISGKLSMKADLRAALMKREGYGWMFVKHDDKLCSLVGVLKNGEVWKDAEGNAHTITYTIEDAKQAKLDSKDNWKNNPKDMLYARAISRLQRRMAPEVTKGMNIPDASEVTFDKVIEATEMRMPEEIKQEVVTNAVA